MQIENLTPGGFASNCYLVTEGKTAILIDCTCATDTLLAALAKRGATLSAVLLTHGHFDHMLTAAEIKAATGAPICLAQGDADLPADGNKNAFATFFGFDRTYPDPDRLLADGERLTFGGITLSVMATPGHTRGSVLYLGEGLAFTGDTIFAAGYGRYDLYGGDPATLARSLRAIAALPHTLRIYPGHGEDTTLGKALDALHLRKNN